MSGATMGTMAQTTPYVSHADLGGQAGHGAVLPEPEGELFHADWEPRVLALTKPVLYISRGTTHPPRRDASKG